MQPNSAQANENEALLFEVLERCVRLYSHIDRSRKTAYRPGARATVQLKIAKEAQKLVEKHFHEILTRYNNAPEISRPDVLRTGLRYLTDIHTRVLLAVPRPYEPIELVSYLRQTLFTDSDTTTPEPLTEVPEVFASEELGDQAHDRFYWNLGDSRIHMQAAEAAHGDLLQFAEQELNSNSSDVQQSNIGYVSLPRIDLGNPCRWPSLLHEVGHFYYDNEKIWKSFCDHIGNDRLSSTISLLNDFSTEGNQTEELKAWLQECWCDAFAITRAGPSAFFAQLHAFFFCSPCYLTEGTKKGAKYPPAWFRLKLLLSISKSRFLPEDPEAASKIYTTMEWDKQLVYRLFDVPQNKSPQLFQLLHIFRDFLGKEFARSDFQKTSNISLKLLNKMVDDLKSGLPIPAVEYRQNGTEIAATTAEILLAGWIHRCTIYKEEFLNLICQWNAEDQASSFMLLQKLRAKVDRADECLKRSIQVVEWFKILDHTVAGPGYQADLREEDPDGKHQEDTSGIPGLLSDKQLRAMINSEDLRIIPLIDFDRQVRGSVIDLRLGHNFEIFFSNVHGAIDPLVSRSEDDPDSMEVDVDFLKPIAIGPGQFILAHTLEYIKLPAGLAAQVEGRSSFARLGLQIHMTANLVEAGFDGCLTLEIANCGHSTIMLYPGMRIAQLRFFRLVTPPAVPYAAMLGNKYRGLLSHNKTQQFSDWEVAAFSNAKKRPGYRKG